MEKGEVFKQVEEYSIKIKGLIENIKQEDVSVNAGMDIMRDEIAWCRKYIQDILNCEVGDANMYVNYLLMLEEYESRMYRFMDIVKEQEKGKQYLMNWLNANDFLVVRS